MSQLAEALQGQPLLRAPVAQWLCTCINAFGLKDLMPESDKPPELMKRLVREGKLGKKSGEGFYRW